MTDVAEEFFANPLAADDGAPYGYTVDRVTGEKRPKLRPGRPRRSDEVSPELEPGSPPSLDELRAARRKDGGAEDRPPAKGRARKVKAPPVQAPPYRPGVIQEGMNRLYRKTGKIVKAMDRDIGIAIIESTHDDEDGTGSVGWAWDQLAKTNPRIRAFLLKTMQGGAWGALITAHAPIFMAIIMKDGIRKHIPFMRLLGAWAEPDEDSAPGEGGLPGGMTMADMQSMMTMAQNLMGQTGVTVPPRRTPPESPEVA